MTIGGDYSNPVLVNGYSCRNCTDVEYARKNIDPAHPKDGPFGVNAERDQAARASKVRPDPAAASPAVVFGGDLKPPPVGEVRRPDPATGARLDISV